MKFLRYLLFLGVLALCIRLSLWLFEENYFKISVIHLTGNYKMIEKDIVSKLYELKSRNLVYIDAKKVEKAIASDPRIAKISIKKKYPNKLLIAIEEKSPFVYLRKDDKFLLVDKELNIFGYMDEKEIADIPIINPKSDEELADYDILLSNITNNELFKNISEIRKIDNRFEIVLINGVVIITDIYVNKEKYDKAYKLYLKLKEERTIDYMDIRFKDVSVK